MGNCRVIFDITTQSLVTALIDKSISAATITRIRISRFANGRILCKRVMAAVSDVSRFAP